MSNIEKTSRMYDVAPQDILPGRSPSLAKEDSYKKQTIDEDEFNLDQEIENDIKQMQGIENEYEKKRKADIVKDDLDDFFS